MIARVRPGTAVNFDRGAESIPIGNRAGQLDLQVMNLPFLGQVADQHQRMVILFVGHDVEVAVVIQIESDG